MVNLLNLKPEKQWTLGDYNNIRDTVMDEISRMVKYPIELSTTFNHITYKKYTGIWIEFSRFGYAKGIQAILYSDTKTKKKILFANHPERVVDFISTIAKEFNTACFNHELIESEKEDTLNEFVDKIEKITGIRPVTAHANKFRGYIETSAQYKFPNNVRILLKEDDDSLWVNIRDPTDVQLKKLFDYFNKENTNTTV